VLDVDDFKFINDKYDHPHGDEILRRVAGALTVATRLSRLLADRDVTVSMGVAGHRDTAISTTDATFEPC
jgi:GGDEF domain-containing protein